MKRDYRVAPAAPKGRCELCGLNRFRFPEHSKLHPSSVLATEARNLALRDSLGLPPGGGARLGSR